MFNKLLDYINQPAKSSFRRVNITPEDLVPTFEPKVEPLWQSVLLDYRDMPMAILEGMVSFVQNQKRILTKRTLNK